MKLRELKEYCDKNEDADACYDLAHRYLSIPTYMEEMQCEYLPDRRMLLENGYYYLNKALEYGHPKAEADLKEVCAEMQKHKESDERREHEAGERKKMDQEQKEKEEKAKKERARQREIHDFSKGIHEILSLEKRSHFWTYEELSKEVCLNKETIEEVILYLEKKRIIRLSSKNDSGFRLSYLKPYYNKKLRTSTKIVHIVKRVIYWVVISLIIFLLYYYMINSYIFLGVSYLITWKIYCFLFRTLKAVRIVEDYYGYSFFGSYRVIKSHHDQLSFGDSQGYVSFQISRQDFRKLMKTKVNTKKLPYGVSIRCNMVNCIITMSYQDF